MNLSSPRRLLVGTDFSEPSDLALQAAIQLALAAKPVLELVHVFAVPGVALPFADSVLLGSPEHLAAMQARIGEALEQRAATVRAAGLQCSAHAIPGSAEVELVRRAKEVGADLLVLGTHGRSGLSHTLLGSVAERVVQHAGCPVLVIPSSARQG